MRTLRRVCVFCGSNAGLRPDYCRAAGELGQELVRRGIGLVYGGAAIGCMGATADAVLAAGGDVIGVMPRHLVEKEIAHQGLSKLHVVGSMHERKALMAELADGFIALPGGMGTLEEIFEVVTWAQLGMHSKPCGLLDVAGFYTDLARFLDHVRDERFVKPEHRNILMSAQEPGALLDLFACYAPPTVTKWIRATPDGAAPPQRCVQEVGSA